MPHVSRYTGNIALAAEKMGFGTETVVGVQTRGLQVVFLGGPGVSESDVTEVQTPANLPYVLFMVCGFWTSGPLRTNSMTGVEWQKNVSTVVPDIQGGLVNRV